MPLRLEYNPLRAPHLYEARVGGLRNSELEICLEHREGRGWLLEVHNDKLKAMMNASPGAAPREIAEEKR